MSISFFKFSFHSSTPPPFHRGSKTSGITLDDCLQSYFTSQALSGSNAYACDHCGQSTEALKSQHILNLPDSLILSLKRFRYDAQTHGKVGGWVDFPLYDLDLSNYLTSELHSQDNNTTDADTISIEIQDQSHPSYKNSLYELYAVVAHRGGMRAGHYIAYCKHIVSGQWLEFDDELVTKRTESYVAGQEAYLLFYRKMTQAPSSLPSSPSRDVVFSTEVESKGVVNRHDEEEGEHGDVPVLRRADIRKFLEVREMYT